MSKRKYEKISSDTYTSLERIAEQFIEVLKEAPENPIKEFMNYHIQSICNKIASELEKTKKEEIISKIKSGEISIQNIKE